MKKVLVFAMTIAMAFSLSVCAFTKQTETSDMIDDKYPYGKPQTDEVARGSGNREYGCRRLREKLPNFSGVSFF